MIPYRSFFSKSMLSALQVGLKLAIDFPQSRSALKKIIFNQSEASQKRLKLEKQGIFVPPLLIVSTTEVCNLKCRGCYAHANVREKDKELSRSQIDNILSQASELGVSALLLAGGEPLLSQHWLDAASNRPELLSLVFTNGTLFGDAAADNFSQNRSLFPLFSVEGSQEKTDYRRGSGVFQLIQNGMTQLFKRKIPFGLSITTGEHNIDEVINDGFLSPFVKLGCRLCIFVEYVPISKSDEKLALSEANRKKLQKYCQSKLIEKVVYPIAFPGDEELFGGCLAAGRGFVHLNAFGGLEPCPFTPVSDSDVKNQSLLEALKSPLFKKIRSESHNLRETVGGCALRSEMRQNALI